MVKLLRSFALAAAVALVAVLAVPATASAQGTCRCNNGCHANPGQCVQNSSNNCAAGYAPFCANRAGTCPMAGWISCAGDCLCISIPGFDAGTTPGDGSVSMDVPAPPPDGPVSMDAPLRTDAPVSMDARVPPGDSPTPPPMDAGVPCPDGVVVDGVCYTERCQYQTEIGWVCATRGRVCRIVGDVPYCVPTCAGEMCPSGMYCDPLFGCRTGTPTCATTTCAAGQYCDPVAGCVSDRCPTMTCPSGQVCEHSACMPAGSGDGGARGDGAAGDAGRRGGQGGCGCRTAGGDARGARTGGVLGALVGLALVASRRRRRRDGSG